MKTTRTILALVLLICGLAAGAAMAQAGVRTANPTRSTTYAVSSVGGSGVTGQALVADFDGDLTAVVVELEGTAPGVSHPMHFHAGDCGGGGGIEVPLTSIDGATGLSLTLVDMPYDEVAASDYYLNVHQSPDAMGTIVACGDVGAGVRPIRQQATEADGGDMGDNREGGVGDAEGDGVAEGAADDEAAEGAGVGAPAGQQFQGPSTASYGLFQVAGSDINGQVQLTEDVQGGTKFVVTLVNIDEGQEYPMAMYRGDCGPDREQVLELDPVGEFPDDPYASVTETELTLSDVTSDDYFIYVFRDTMGGEVVACGEVGVGANR